MHPELFEAVGATGRGDHDAAVTLVRDRFPRRVPTLLGWTCDPVSTRHGDDPADRTVARDIGLNRWSTGPISHSCPCSDRHRKCWPSAGYQTAR